MFSDGYYVGSSDLGDCDVVLVGSVQIDVTTYQLADR